MSEMMPGKAQDVVDGVDEVDGVDDVYAPLIEVAEIPNLCVTRLVYRPAQGAIAVQPHECSRPSDQVMCRHFAPRADFRWLCQHGSQCCTSEQAATESTLQAISELIRAATCLADRLKQKGGA